MKELLLLTLFCFCSAQLPAQCVAAWTFDDTNLMIQFTDQSTSPGDPIVSWFWDFDDGTTSNQQNPLHTFAVPDKYDVELTITTAGGCTDNLKIRIEICEFTISVAQGSCNANMQIPLTITVNDLYDNAKDVDITVDGNLVPGSPFPISQGSPVVANYNVAGDGLPHVINVQSTDIPTCNEAVTITVPDCGSNCFLSALDVSFSGGTTHTVIVGPGGNNSFSPASTTIVIGDLVHFTWQDDGHSTTSDATSGPDSWNSGILGIGSTYDVTIHNPGIHNYYCIPHGGPGGVGMSGNIVANCPSGNNFTLNITFNTTQANPGGFNVLVDGVVQPGSPHSYNGTGPQTTTASLTGDGLPHVIKIQDVDVPTCEVMASFAAPDCGAAPQCQLMVSAVENGPCNAANQVPVDVTITAINPGAQGFNITVDGATAPGGPFTYSTGGPTVVTVNVPGNGQNHTITAVDVSTPSCSASTALTTTDCAIPCSLTNLTASTGTAATHVVLVEDFQFNPANITITAGDVVEWQWTGSVAHTSTSDAASGPNSWNSGLLSTGATFTSPTLTAGIHPYYCIPHGGPGGVGMSGTITVQADCTNGMVSVAIAFDETGGGFGGFNVLVDGVTTSGSPYVYDPSGANSLGILVPGDGQSHTIEVVDVDDPGCSVSTSVTTPDCNAPTCQLTVSANENGPCDANDNVPVDVTVDAVGAGSQGFSLKIDGTTAPGSPFSYAGPSTTVTVDVPGDGQAHTIEVADVADPACSATTSITTTDCVIPCSLTNLTASTGSATTHVVLVEDFIFSPKNITITTGDVVEWQWTGAIAHTSTSDATSGPNSWNSGLLTAGATFTSPVLENGTHPYYCIPHGGPGGVGMSGTITVVPDCTNGMVAVNLTFDETGGSFGGYRVLVDGMPVDTFNYDPGGSNSVNVSVAGDGLSHTLVVEDLENPACSASTSVTTPDCSFTPPCEIALTGSVGICSNDSVTVELSVDALNAGSGFNLFVDGTAWPDNPVNYAANGPTVINVGLPGDGQGHEFIVQDVDDIACGDTLSLTVPACTVPCSMADLTLATGGSANPVTHIVEVKDFEFSPKHITLTTGDIVRWEWTGTIAHTSTSDATSGALVWDSGLLGNGAFFEITVSENGFHPYYCIPHGGPGGIGMSGTITAVPPCDSGQVAVTASFSVTNGSPGGFNLTVDGNPAPGSPFAYATSGATTVTVQVLGDGAAHTIVIEDVDDPACSISGSITTPDCNPPGGPCELTVAAEQVSGCDSNDQIGVELTVTGNFTGSAFNVEVDGNAVTGGPFSYDPNGTTVLTIELPGDGLSHDIAVADVDSTACTASTAVATPLCGAPCEISGLNVEIPNPVTHTVEVKDFEFVPKNLTINLGDTVHFVWTGTIQHTTTSDATSGPDSWDSGLLGQGATFDLVLTTEGLHPYYCIPHGGPGGVGMAGTILVENNGCQDGQIIADLTFQSSNTGSGFNLFVDGSLQPGSPFSYDPLGNNLLAVQLPGDGASHSVVVTDADEPACADTTAVTTPNCSVNCSVNLTAEQDGDCDSNNEIPYLVTVHASNAGSGFDLKLDGNTVPGSPFSYDPGGATFLTVNLPGDGLSHTLEVTDLDSTACSDLVEITTPDCSPVCFLTANIGQTGGCDGGQVPYDLTVEMLNGGTAFSVTIDGMAVSGSPFDYAGATTTVSLILPGDGLTHELIVSDLDQSGCADTLAVMTPDCSAGCSLSGLEIEVGIHTVHIVEVQDFNFSPENLTVAVGDSVRFVWTGQVPHTATSYATSGADVFNSGLLGQGSVFTIVIHEAGVHDYYCIPHEAMGMVGSITAVEPCDDGALKVGFGFQVSNGGAGYHVFLDGNELAGSPFDYAGAVNFFDATLPANGQPVTLLIQDANDPDCSLAQTFTMPDCADPCFGYEASWTADIDHPALTVQFTNTSGVAATTYFWQFGDGTTSTEENPSHVYGDAGEYQICLTIGDGPCESTHCETFFVGQYLCEANFSLENDGLTVSVFDQSITTDNVSEWTWSFGNNHFITGEQNTSFTYDDLGVYTICLTISAGQCQDDTCIVVDLTDPCLLFSPDFAYSVSDDLTVTFFDLTSGTPNQWLWGFGDTNTSNLQNPQHTYDAPGNYNICLLVQDTETGCNASKCEVIQVGTTGVEELGIGNWELGIYPNPSASQNFVWTIEGIQPEDFGQQLGFVLYDMQGKSILDTEVRGGERVIFNPSQRLASGLHVVELRSEAGRVYRGRVVVQ